MESYLDKDGLIYYDSKLKYVLSNKVDKINGKGLSTNDYITEDKNKVNNLIFKNYSYAVL